MHLSFAQRLPRCTHAQVWDVAEDGVTRGAVIEAAGHRSDVRAVALSSDDASLLSASSAAVKVRQLSFLS